jgi:hypothetical protein
MSKRGRQYYDPIVQESYEGPDNFSRIEVFQDPSDASLRRWCSHLVNPDGSIGSEDFCDGDRDHVISLAQNRWPGLDVFELQEPNEDSTWEGMGPTPRLWQGGASEAPSAPVVPLRSVEAAPEPDQEDMPLRVVALERPGTYVLLEDIRALLLFWATSYDEMKNPSGAVALREAVEVLREIG